MHRETFVSTCCAIGLTLLSACGTDRATGTGVDPSVTTNAAAMQGNWQQPVTIPGAAFSFTVTAHDSTVSGVGYYAIEAGRSGTITVTGVAGVRQTTLDFVFDYGTEAHFRGPAVSGPILDGALKYGPPSALNPSFAVTLVKQ